jgi:D-sedoheptulose 7-phosphate isomerase
MTVIGLLGQSGGKLKDLCDISIRVPEQEVFKIQELHLPIYHVLCLAIEETLFGS